jgi:hypothetical protein
MNSKQRDALISTLHKRFEAHPERHRGISWQQVRQRLDAVPKALDALHAMESTGGEPDVISHDRESGAVTFCDCSAETPAGRRGLCYDSKALAARKEHKPQGNAVDMAQKMGVELLTEQQYRDLQQLGEFDRKTSSWIHTPADVRALGGALFCDRRYGRVFVYHNGAQSYYAVRAFRALRRV